MDKSLRGEVIKYIKKKYKADPEHLWKSYPDYIVFRHEDNNKWFAAVMDVAKDKLGLTGAEKVDVLNVKLDDIMFKEMLLHDEGFLPAYHMSKEYWISVLLDGTVPFEEISGLIDISYDVTASKKKKEKSRPSKDWIVPANPKFYDIIHAFDKENVITWKQSSSIKVGDTIYMYVAAPVSAILYKCKAVEVDIPYNYSDKNLTITKLMKIKLLKKYDSELLTFERLKEEFGIYAIRGPRGVPNSLKKFLEGVNSRWE